MFGEMIIIHATGSDAGDFLQGQLTCDIGTVQGGKWCLSAYCNPQGKVLVLLWLIPAPEGFWLAVPRALSAAFLQRIRRYILRSAVVLTETPLHFQALPGDNPEKSRILCQDGKLICLGGIAGIRPVIGIDIPAPLPEAVFRAACIRAGIAVIHNTQHCEQFLPQMLNLQAYDGLSFNKGCYLGQEGIARSEYKSTIRRHLAYAESAAPQQNSNTVLYTENAAPAGHILSCGQDKAGMVIQAVVNDHCLDKPLRSADNHYPLIFHSYH